MFHHSDVLSDLIHYHMDKFKCIDPVEHRYTIEGTGFSFSVTFDKSLSDYKGFYRNSKNIEVVKVYMTSWLGRWHSETTLSFDEVPNIVLFHLLNNWK